MVVVLNVAEKPSIAKTMAASLSGGNSRSRTGFSKYNMCYDFRCRLAVQGCFAEQEVDMVVTSVSGHVMGVDFPAAFAQWTSFSPSDLFEAPLERKVLDTSKDIEKTLRREARNARVLVIWTDNDREGEAIGQEIVDICASVNAGLVVKRARFSVANATNLWQALRNLDDMNQRSVDAVAARNEIDLRLGAVFTRFQTLELERLFPEVRQGVISFGPCQFPTLGFVVDRAEEIRKFISEPFWTIHLSIQSPELEQRRDIQFDWDRVRLFDHFSCAVLFEMCVDDGRGIISSVNRTNKSKWRPLPLSTVELQIRMSKFFRMASERTMSVAEKLYMKGYISYPRTETDIFENSFDLRALVEVHRASPQWGQYTAQLLDSNQFQWPRAGRNNDQSHPPIHPTAFVDPNSLENDDQRKVYEFVVRHFIACCSQDALGSETVVSAQIGGEGFHTRGLEIIAKNFLNVYTYERWGERSLPNFTEGMEFVPSILEMNESITKPPGYLTEVELIRLMDRNGIGTDATIQDHINTIQKRSYAVKRNNVFIPEPLGFALVLGYKRIGHGASLSKPQMRAAMEQGFVQVCQGTKTKQQVVSETIELFKDIYSSTLRQAQILYDEISRNLSFQPGEDPGDPGNDGFEGGGGGNGGPGGGGNGGGNGGGGGGGSGMRSFGRNVQDRIKDYKCKTKGFLKCGTCGTKTIDLRQQNKPGPPGPRGGKTFVVSSLLHCRTCDGLFRLPSGKISSTDHTCVLCQFQVVNIQKEGASSSSNGYNVCPKCYNTKPAIGDIEEAKVASGVPCFKCSESSCPLSGGMIGESTPVMPCMACSDGKLHLKKSKKGGLMMSCSNYPTCKDGTIWVSETVVEGHPSKENCPSCGTTLLDMTFKLGSLGPGVPSKQLVCPRASCGYNPMFLDMVFRYPTVSSAINLPAKRSPFESHYPAESIQSGFKRICPSAPPANTTFFTPALSHVPQHNQPTTMPTRFTPNPYSPPQQQSHLHANGPLTTTTTEQDVSTITCVGHGLPCIQLRSSKKNENEGRYFYKCSLPQGQNCNFFKWADEADGKSGGLSGGFTTAPSRSYTGNKSSGRGSRGGKTGKGKGRGGSSSASCFKCNQSGHYANACPTSQSKGGGFSNQGGSSGVGIKSSVCYKCNQIGHFAKSCPNI